MQAPPAPTGNRMPHVLSQLALQNKEAIYSLLLRASALEEIGQEFALTRERIRQIEAKALRAFRGPDRGRRLRALMAAKH